MGALRILAGGCVPAAVSLLLATAAPGAARAAFELRDAAPMALGAVSPDGASLPFDSSSAGGSGLSWRAGGSRASLFEAEGLEQSQLDLELGFSAVALRLGYLSLSGPGSRESSARLTLAEGAGRTVSLGLEMERLDSSAEDSPGRGGWALGARARGRIDSRITAWIGAERILRTRPLDRAGLPA